MFERARVHGIVVLVCLIAVTSAGARSGAGDAQALTITSTLDGKNLLPHRIRWIARPRPITRITQVDFLIDGKTRWIEHNAPYAYGDDSNWLVTSWLSPGRHRFTVRAKTRDGRTAQRTTIARVLPVAPPPAELDGRWTRTVTDEQAGKSTPGGTWKLAVDKTGWKITDPNGSTNYIDVAYQAANRLEARGGILTRPKNDNIGGNGWCEDTNAPVDYRWSVAADTLTLTLDGRDRCGTPGDEQHRIWAGAWTKVP